MTGWTLILYKPNLFFLTPDPPSRNIFFTKTHLQTVVNMKLQVYSFSPNLHLAPMKLRSYYHQEEWDQGVNILDFELVIVYAVLYSCIT